MDFRLGLLERRRVYDFLIFRLFKSIVFFVNWISLYIFPFLIKYCHIMFIIIVFWLGNDRPSGLFFLSSPLYFFPYSHLSSYLLLLFLYLFIFCCFHVQVCGKTLVHELHISYSHTEWYLLFSDSGTTSAPFVFGAKKWKYLCTSKPIRLN